MAADPRPLALTLDLPALPASLARMARLLADPQHSSAALAGLVEADMALAAAVLRVVNSSLFGLNGRVQTVQHAITYLGTVQVAALTYEAALRNSFPAAQALQPVWQRASARSALFGRLARELGTDAWAAHAAGLFEECGKAALFRHDAVAYAPLLVPPLADDAAALLDREQLAFGTCHDIVAAALCETWGLSPAAVHWVRHQHGLRQHRRLPPARAAREVAAVALLADALALPADDMTAVADAVAEPLGWDRDAVRHTLHALQAEALTERLLARLSRPGCLSSGAD
jgi:HD-like signal output (HDOD) protein